jgi:hypothetical protein
LDRRSDVEWRGVPQQASAIPVLATMLRMPLRVIALVLSVILFWSGLSTIEAPRAFAPPLTEQQHAITRAGGLAAAHEGSVEHHHLDDLPSQAQIDPPTETPGLLPAPLNPGAQDRAAGRPRSFVSNEVASPFLAGPLRPPCGAALAA